MIKDKVRIGVFLVAALASALVFSGHASAQDKPKDSLGNLFSQMLRGSDGDTPSTQADDGEEPARRVPFGRQDMQLSFAPLVRQTAPAIVNVYASSRTRAQSPFMGDPFFEQFFGRQMPPRVQSSLGSGVLVDASGIIVTNNHVIHGADDIKVALPDGREFKSKILLKDETLDLAVLKIDGDKPFPTIDIGNSDALEVGDLVLAIGNPFGVGQTTTSGIVSAVARSHIGISDFGYFIQTDAAINPGNSGGALINMQGQLAGINTAIFSKSGGSVGIGFAIPSNMVRAVVTAAKNGADFFERPYIGASFDPVTPQIADALGMAQPTGALVTNVADDGPAGKAGLKPGDVVVAMNGNAIEDPEALNYRLATQPVGNTIDLDVMHRGEKDTLKIRLERAPKGNTAEVTIGGQGPFAGAQVADLSPYLAQKLRLPVNLQGVTVTDVERGSPAENLGLQPRDIIREINGETVASAAQLKQRAEANGRWWRFTIERNGHLLRQTMRY